LNFACNGKKLSSDNTSFSIVGPVDIPTEVKRSEGKQQRLDDLDSLGVRWQE
jgi:hypothetical protein